MNRLTKEEFAAKNAKIAKLVKCQNNPIKKRELDKLLKETSNYKTTTRNPSNSFAFWLPDFEG